MSGSRLLQESAACRRLDRGKLSVVQISVDAEALATFCRQHGIRRLALFGSALRGEMGPDSDVDLLVEFEPGRVPGLIRIAQMELALSPLFDGREIELRTYGDVATSVTRCAPRP